jgi:hypothetical protein
MTSDEIGTFSIPSAELLWGSLLIASAPAVLPMGSLIFRQIDE